MTGKYIFTLLAMTALLGGSAHADSDYDSRFLAAYQRTLQHLLKIQSSRPFKLAAANDSLEKTAQASRNLGVPSSPAFEETARLLETARTEYPNNSFAILLQALLYDRIGQSDKANLHFVEFLEKSAKSEAFDQKFLKNVDYHELRRGVVVLLESRGQKYDSPNKFRFPMSLKGAYPLFLAFVLIGGALLSYDLFKIMWKRFGPLPREYRYCPHCREPVLKLMTECPNCRHPLDQ